ncbi:MAG: hypothetical protein R2758_16190 [Bacteroidales bacterium]
MSFDLENLVSDLDIRGAVLYYKGNVDSETITKALDLVERKLLVTREAPRLRKRFTMCSLRAFRTSIITQTGCRRISCRTA